jgi:hypothetical protein
MLTWQQIMDGSPSRGIPTGTPEVLLHVPTDIAILPLPELQLAHIPHLQSPKY